MSDGSDGEFFCVIIGAGVVGLAAAAELARRVPSLLVIERRAGPGRETTSRNSQVIHAGLYYEPDSLKARLCVRGKRLLYEACARYGLPHRALGKLVVATAPAQLAELEELHARALQNDAGPVELLDGRRARSIEPRLAPAAGALLSKSSGIIDAHALVKLLEGRAKAGGADLLYGHETVGIEPTSSGFSLEIEGPGGQRDRIETRILVNAAGLEADRIASMAGCDRYRQHWCKGDYFQLPPGAGRGLRHLLYPLPPPAREGLGVHITLDLGGRALVGPDATYVERERASYDVDPAKAELFGRAAARLVPDLAGAELAPDTSGIRPKLAPPGEPAADFVVELERQPANLVDLIGIESPGLTAALAIGERVTELLAAAELLPR